MTLEENRKAHDLQSQKPIGPEISNRVELAVAAIEWDISGRSGLKDVWAEMDDDIKADIRVIWREIVRQAIA